MNKYISVYAMVVYGKRGAEIIVNFQAGTRNELAPLEFPYKDMHPGLVGYTRKDGPPLHPIYDIQQRLHNLVHEALLWTGTGRP